MLSSDWRAKENGAGLEISLIDSVPDVGSIVASPSPSKVHGFCYVRDTVYYYEE